MKIDDLLDELADRIVARIEERVVRQVPAATTPPHCEWMTTKRAAAFLSVGVSTLENYRRKNIGPQSTKRATGQVRYQRAVLEAYLTRKKGAAK